MMTGTRLNDCTPMPDGQAKYADVRKDEREAALLQTFARMNEALARVTDERDAALAEIAKQQSEIEELAAKVGPVTERNGELRERVRELDAEIARLRAPPEADVMEIAYAVARALTDYGDQCVAKADRLRIPPDEQAKYGAASATEREAQIARAKLYIRSDRYVSNPTKPPPRTQDFIAWLDAALAALEKARTEATVAMEQLSRLRADAGDTEVNYARELSRMKAEIARLRAPPSADVMELAWGLISGGTVVGQELANRIARALTAYGDQRAHDARQQMLVDSTPLREAVAREARTAAFEEAAQIANDQTSDDPQPGDWNDACSHIRDALRALDAPPQSEEGKG
jgi:hypothetical protein